MEIELYIPRDDAKTIQKTDKPWKFDISFPVHKRASASAPLPINSCIIATCQHNVVRIHA